MTITELIQHSAKSESESWDGITVLQQWFIAHWSRPVFRQWLQMELLNGLEVPEEVDQSTLYDAVYLGRIMPWIIDPVKEVNAWKERVKGGGASHAQSIRAGGKNPQEYFAKSLQNVSSLKRTALF